MKKMLSDKYFILLARIVVGFIFVAFGIEKIFEPAKFANEIGNYQILPEFLLNLVALFMPWMELVIGLFLLTGIRLKANSVIAGSLLLLFIVAISIAMARGLSISCGCSSSNAQMVGFPKLIENTTQLILCVLIYLAPNNQFSLERFAKTE